MSDELEDDIQFDPKQETAWNDAVENGNKPIKWHQPKPVHAGQAVKRTRQVIFLKALAEFGTLTQAAKVARVNAATHRKWLDADPWFREQFKEALQNYRDLVAEEIHNRAIHGVEVPIIGKVQTELGPEDAIIGHKTVKSDLLLMFHAKRVDPAYRDNHVQERTDDTPVETVSPLTRITITLDTMEQRRTIDITPGKGRVIDTPVEESDADGPTD